MRAEVTESIQRSNTLLERQDFPSFAWEACPALDVQASRDTEDRERGGGQKGGGIFISSRLFVKSNQFRLA